LVRSNFQGSRAPPPPKQLLCGTTRSSTAPTRNAERAHGRGRRGDRARHDHAWSVVGEGRGADTTVLERTPNPSLSSPAALLPFHRSPHQRSAANKDSAQKSRVRHLAVRSHGQGCCCVTRGELIKGTQPPEVGDQMNGLRRWFWHTSRRDAIQSEVGCTCSRASAGCGHSWGPAKWSASESRSAWPRAGT
jgi:hypothetical protein